MTEDDIHWLTTALCHVVEPHGGRVISVLEGGYSLESAPDKIVGVSKKGKGNKPPGTSISNSGDKLRKCKFAQKEGDGGLVKGVLSHVAGLAGVDGWTHEC